MRRAGNHSTTSPNPTLDDRAQGGVGAFLRLVAVLLIGSMSAGALVNAVSLL